MKKLQKADTQIGKASKSFLTKSMPFLMKTLKYQGYALTRDPQDDLLNKVDQTMSYYMPNLAETIHNLESKGSSNMKSFA